MFKKSDFRVFGAVFISTFLTIAVSARYASEVKDPSKTTVICESGGVPMIGNVPDPLNCYKFYTCVTTDSNPETTSIPMNCAEGPRNTTLFYDFRTCTCAYDSSVCYDDRENRIDFYICAQEYKPPAVQ